MQRSYNAIISELLIAETKNKVEKQNEIQNAEEKTVFFTVLSSCVIISR